MHTLALAVPTASPLFAPWRIGLTYAWRHGRLPDLDHPRLFTELVQHRKLHERDATLACYVDKVRVKAIVAAQIGPAWIIPTLWHGDSLPARPCWPMPFVVKSRHGCNQTAFVRDDTVDWPALRKRSNRWMARDYGRWLDEWLYRHIPRGILVEPLLGSGPAPPLDYKFYVFHGRVEFIQVHLERFGRHRWIVLDRRWRRVSAATADPDPARPATLAKMIEAAETLAGSIDFVRVDLYEIGGKPRFGEMTFYPGSGLDRFDPVALDAIMGALWCRGADNAVAPREMRYDSAVVPATKARS